MTTLDHLTQSGRETARCREYEDATSDWDRTADRRALHALPSAVFRVMDHADAAIQERIQSEAGLLAEVERLRLIIDALDRSELRIVSAGGLWTLKEFIEKIAHLTAEAAEKEES